MAREYDHLFKLLIIGDSGKLYILVYQCSVCRGVGAPTYFHGYSSTARTHGGCVCVLCTALCDHVGILSYRSFTGLLYCSLCGPTSSV